MPANKLPPATAWIALGLCALVLRMGVVFLLWSPDEPVWTYEHGEIAENLVAGRGFRVTFLGADGPTSQQAPLYPMLLAGAYRLFGVASPAALLAVQLSQCVAGTLLVLVVVWLGRSLLPDRPAVAWIAGCGAAVYPAHLYMVTHIQVAVWAALLLALLLAVVLAPRGKGRWKTALAAGVVAGGLLLVEPIMVIVLPIVAVVLWLRQLKRDASQDSRHLAWPAGAQAAAFIGVTLAVIAPWLARNAWVHGEFVFVKSTFGYALWQGNHPRSWGTDKIPKPVGGRVSPPSFNGLTDWNRDLWAARHETIYIDDALLTAADYRQLSAMPEPARSRHLGRRAVAFIVDDPARYAQLCLRRLRYFLLFDETNPKTTHPVYRLSTVIWLVLSVAGMILLRRDWRAVWPTVAVFAGVAVFHALTIVSARFRIPIEPLSFIWAGTAVHVAGRYLVVLTSFTWHNGNIRQAT